MIKSLALVWFFHVYNYTPTQSFFKSFLFYYLLYANGQVQIHVLLEFSMNFLKKYTSQPFVDSCL